MFRSSKAAVVRVAPRREVQQRVYAYHAHDPREVLTVLGVTDRGLSEKAVRQRTEQFGQNRFTEVSTDSWWQRVVAQVTAPLSIVLVITFFVTLGIGEYIDAGVILAALVLAVLVGLFQEEKASRSFAVLTASQARTATVLRGGVQQQIDAQALVPGDVVILQSGNYVPADIRLLYSKELQINESTLTGEWVAVPKHHQPVPVGTPVSGRSSMAYMGTFVTHGYAQGVVVATGAATEVGHLAADLTTEQDLPTPLQVEMAKISRVMLSIISALTVVIFVIGVLRGHSMHEMLLMAIAVAVASIPEGLPAAVTIVLAIGMMELLKRGGLVRNLLAAETLGATTYVITDKTGTLTEGVMAIVGVLVDGTNMVARSSFGPLREIVTLFDTALVATAAYTDVSAEASPIIRGDAAEVAILEVARELGIDELALDTLRNKRIDYVPFSSEKRYAAGLVTTENGYQVCINGAPRALLQGSTAIMKAGVPVTLTKLERQAIDAKIGTLSLEGKRLIAVAAKAVAYDDIPDADDDLVQGLTLYGIFVIDDPVRAHVDAAIDGVQAAGARVVLVTGDGPETAHTVAAAAGIIEPGDPVIHGEDLELLSDDELLTVLRDVAVFARILPEQKLRIVSVLQQHGEIVAMTGDGVNDAPALRRAHIGVAIGSGTEVAKEASDLVLVNDSFSTVYAAIEEGRRIMSNIRKIVGYLLATSLTEVILISLALIAAAPIPILPAQILWANIIEEGFMSVAFAFEASERGSMRRRPHDLHEEGVLSTDMLWFLTFVVTILSMITGALYFYVVQYMQLPIETVRSIMFVAISIDSLFIAVSFRSLTVPLWRIPLFSNRFFAGAFIMSTLALALPLSVPFFSHVLSYEPLSFSLFMLPVLTSLGALLVVELGKALFFTDVS